jgi:Protamine and protamine like
MLTEIVVLGGLVWSYCSVACQQKIVHRTYEEVEKQLKNCKDCLNEPGPRPATPNDLADGPVCARIPTNLTPTQKSSSPSRNRKNPGKITNNSFFNYMREIRKCHDVTPATAAAEWWKLSDCEKMKFQIKEYKKRK